MHSFQPSRGKVLFEVLCALAISASLAGAWMQTGASALLAAAGVAGFYGLIHLFDMKRPRAAVVAEPQRIAFAADGQTDLVADEVASGPAKVDPQPEPQVEELVLVEPAAPPAKAPRKSRAKRSSAKEPKVTELAPAEEVEVKEPAPAEELTLTEAASHEDEEFVFPETDEEATHSHIAPLFEPEPFARMPRRAFGRRGRL